MGKILIQSIMVLKFHNDNHLPWRFKNMKFKSHCIWDQQDDRVQKKTDEKIVVIGYKKYDLN